jgi:hypothetical protein
MTSQPDKLFREKLENFQRPVSAAAWERIESGLHKNQSKGLWLKFAAGLALFAVATYLLWPVDQIENQQASNSNPVAPNTEAGEKINSEKIAPITAKEESTTPKTVVKNNTKKSNPVVKTESLQKNKVNASDPVVTVLDNELQIATTEAKQIETTPTKTIIYTAEEVNAKFLKKKSPSEATASEKKTSGIQKLMGLAYTIKNPDNGLGDLRQKKDEILALNFLSNEDKTNKEKN